VGRHSTECAPTSARPTQCWRASLTPGRPSTRRGGWPSSRRWTCSEPCCSRSRANSSPWPLRAEPWGASRCCSVVASRPRASCYEDGKFLQSDPAVGYRVALADLDLNLVAHAEIVTTGPGAPRRPDGVRGPSNRREVFPDERRQLAKRRSLRDRSRQDRCRRAMESRGVSATRSATTVVVARQRASQVRRDGRDSSPGHNADRVVGAPRARLRSRLPRRRSGLRFRPRS